MLYGACVLASSFGAPVTTTPSPASTDAAQRREHLRALSDQLPRFGRLVHALKAAQAADGRDRAALVLLFPLVRIGPLRQGALAELVHADPSTVSRHVASLVERGLVTRVADETDGRASRLVVTEAGHAELEQLRREHETNLDRVTADWSEAELATLTTLFGRLLDDLTDGLPGYPCSPGSVAPAAPTDLPAPREKR
jgi:DNA-binding MarR family transcriptional regulator